MNALDLLASCTTLDDLLRWRATEQPDLLAYTFLLDGETQEARLTYGQLDRRARAIGATLESRGARGARVLLLYAPGIEYAVAVLGCLYAGAVAVPAYPPDPARLSRTLPRLQALIADSKASFALTTRDILPMASVLAEQSEELKALVWLATDDVDDASAGAWRDPGATRDTLAILQYTSGSTAAPRGVMLTHGNLLHNLAAIHRCFEHTSESRGVIWLPPYHDMGLIGGVLQPLCGGFPVVLMSPIDFLRRPFRWLQAISRYRATTSGGPNFAYDLCVRKITREQIATLDLSSWDLAFNGAEPIRAETLERFAATFEPCGFRRAAFYPCYGLAEATLIVSGASKERLPTVQAFDREQLQRSRAVAEPADQGGDTERLVGCGAAIPGHEVLVVDPGSMTAAPPGYIGEIWVSGASVAQGYWNRPEETAETFGARLRDRDGTFLRTGDLGFLQGGELFVTGRSKDLIILRGRNHYPQDIELTVERSHPAVRQGCSAAFSVEAAAEERLVVVAEIDVSKASDVAALVSAVRSAVAEQHELQVHAAVLLAPGGIPKTSSGKIQRRACRAGFLSGELNALNIDILPLEVHAEPEPGRGALTRDLLRSAAPEDRRLLLEEYLSRQVARVLGIDPARLDRRRSLSSLGLDSIQAIELKNAGEADLGLTVPMSSFLVAPGVADIAAQLVVQLESSPDVRVDSIQPVPREGGAPLSFAQERFWFLDHLQPGSCAHTIFVAALLEGPLDAAALAQGFDALVRRHESLRTTFPTVDGTPLQVIAEAAPPGEACLSPFGEIVDLGGLPARERDAAWRRLAHAEARQPFDLSEGPLLRVRLLRLAPREHVVLLAIHHIVADGWSMGVLVRELFALYECFCVNRPPSLLDLPIQYADFAVWQRRREEALEADLVYWKRQLGGSLPMLDLPADRPRPPLRTTLGATRSMALPRDLSDALRALCRAEGATLFMLLFAAFNALLHRYTGQEDIVVGSPIAGRNRAETEGLIGCFINMLALRVDLSGAPTFLDLLTRVRGVTLGAYAHQELPFERLVEALKPDRDPSRTPIFQVVFVLQNAPMPELSFGDLTLRALETGTGGAAFDMTMTVTDLAEGMQIALEYSADLFDAATIGRLLDHFRTLLQGIAADPARRIVDLPLLTAEERQTICVAWNQTAQKIEQDACILHLIEAATRRRPHAGAVVCGDHRLDYEQLDRRSNQLANHLRRRGVGPGALVGICLERSLDMVVGLLGILKAGGAYVPLDPAYPRERLSFIMSDAQLAVLVTEGRLAQALPDGGVTRVWLDADRAEIDRESTAPPVVDVRSGSLAYVIYTSGSTGTPKGVEITHHSLVNLLTSMRERPGLGEHDRLLAVTSLSFDIAALDIFLPLSTGALLDVANRELSVDGAALSERLSRAGITVLQATPATFRLLLEAGWGGSKELKILVGGEAVPRELADALVDRAASVWNMYGPTETTIYSCGHPIAKGPGPVPIGRPIANTRVYVLSDRLHPLPVGIPGELYIGGEGLARGYHRRPDLTAERFVEDPFAPEPGGRMYRTGDLVKWLPDGTLDFLGRLDHQVKIRGFRIELGEIESVLGAHPAVGQAVVVAREDRRGDRRLVAYLTARGSGSPTPGELRAHLQEKLPEYMIPSAFVALEAMPLTPNGKVDRRALPAPEQRAVDAGGDLAAPRTPVEEVLAGIWAHVLGLERVGAHDDFFRLGGHSLLAAQVLARLRSVFRIDLPLRALFEAPTLAGLAERVEAAQRASAGIHRPPLRSAGREGAPPLSFAQQRLWFLAQLEPDSAFYNIPGAARIQGPLDRAALEASIQEVARRHEALRTTVAIVDGTPHQVIAPDARLPFEIIDLRALVGSAQEAEVRRRAADEARQPFDLARGPLARAKLLQLGDAEHVLLLTMHHIISDGWSVGVLLKELAALYPAFRRGEPSPLSAVPIQYGDFAAWQRRWLEGEAREEQLAYWKRQLAGAPRYLDLPTDRPRPAVQRFRGATLSFQLSGELTAALSRLSRRASVTPFMTLLAGFQVLLGRHAGVEEVCVGTPVAGRNRMELEGLIGMFVNTLVLRTDLSGAPSFEELLSRVREVALGAFEHQDVPFDQVVDVLQPPRDLSRSPLFQVAFALQNAPLPPLVLEELTLSPLVADSATSKVDLSLMLADAGEGMQGWLEYNTDLFDGVTIERMAKRYLTLLESAAQDPGQRVSELQMLPESEREELLRWWNAAAAPLTPAPLHRRFEAQVMQRFDALAVVGERARVTYGELNRRANRTARELVAAGVRPGDRVALSAARAEEALVGLLAILKAGAAVELGCEGRSGGVALTSAWMASRAAAITGREDNDLPIEPPAEAAALVTGGCSMDHMTVGHAIDALVGALGVGPSDRLQVDGGDGMCLQLLLAAVTGAAVVAPESAGAPGATVAWLSSSALDALGRGEGSALRAIALAEPCAPEVLSRWSHCRVVPVRWVQPGLWLLQEPQPGLECYVLDAHLAPVPVGVAGELYLAAGLSPDVPEAAARFCPHPFSDRAGALLYGTGERVRTLNDGRLEWQDRRGAPASAAAGANEPQEYVAPRTPIEETLAQFWREVLGVERIGAHDNFFDLGGNSLSSTLVLVRIHETWGVEVPAHRIFQAPTLAALAAAIESEQAAVGGVDDGATPRRPAYPPLVPVARSGDSPVSFGQQRLWFLDQLEPDSSFYNIPAAVRIRGPLDTEALERSLREIAARHEVLRTTIIAVHGQPRQVIAPESALALPVVELGAVGETEREQLVQRRAAEEAQRPFNLARGPLLRAELLRLDEQEHVLLLTVHHIISDGWSVGVLLKELAALYPAFRRGEPSPLSALPIQYGDFAAWQRRWLEGEAREEQLAYWKRQLAGAPRYLDLPTDRPRPAVQRFRGATLSFQLSGELTAALSRLSRRASVTPFMTLLAGFQVLLGRHAGVEEVCVGTPVAGRNRMELEGLIGMFVNTLVLRTDLSGAPSFEELLSRVREVALGAFEHQDVPFDQVVDVLQPPRDLSRSPLFQVAFALQNAPLPPLVLEELTLSPLVADSATSKVDLSLMLADAGEGMQGWLEYNTDLFDGVTIERMAKRYLTLLESAAQDPGQRVSELQMLPESEREELLRWWNAAAAPLTPAPLHRRFEAQVMQRFDALAVVGERARVTYGELNRRANRTARELVAAGVRPGDRVALSAARAEEALVGLLAILKAGAAVELGCEGRSGGVALTSAWMASRAAAITGREDNDLPIEPPAEAAALVTGGCSMDHMTVGHAIDALVGALGVGPSDRLQVDGGDGMCLQLLLAAVTGAAVVAPESAGAPGATVAWLSSSALDALGRGEGSALRAIALAEPCAPEVLSRWSHCRVVPVRWVQPGLWLLQEPQPGLECYVLDAHLAPVPVGVAGELYLAAGLSPDVPEAAARFCPHPFSDRAGALLYGTGERVRTLNDGRLEWQDRRGAPASAAAGANEPQEYVAPRTPIEETLAQFWREVLGVERVGAHDNFFDLGGNSLSSTLVLVRIHETWGVEVPAHRIFQAPTLAALAAAIESEQAAVGGVDDGATPRRPEQSALVCMQAGRDHVRPLFFVHGAGGSALDYAELVRHLDPARPFYGIHAPWLDGDEALPASVEAMARSYISELRKIQPSGPYLLGGWSFGGVVAFEMAQQLRAAGEAVAMLALVDSYAATPELAPAPDELTSLAAFCHILGLQGQFLQWDIDHMKAISPRDRLTYVLEQARGNGDPMVDLDQAERWYRAFRRDLDALLRYTPSPYSGAAALFRAETMWGSDTSATDRGWSAWISAGLATYTIPGDHRSMLRAPHVAVLAEALTRHMNDADRYACATRSVHRDGCAVGSARPI
ncbi:amino acid adenylation domain-containing protein [Sorangium sp. So ce1389]|uniref:amino acid adenylation domain-containing protein n=1 Tax=Sorangium sp. So ce1389 TaxID=3133336 RepID=UPI003F603DE5